MAEKFAVWRCWWSDVLSWKCGNLMMEVHRDNILNTQGVLFSKMSWNHDNFGWILVTLCGAVYCDICKYWLLKHIVCLSGLKYKQQKQISHSSTIFFFLSTFQSWNCTLNIKCCDDLLQTAFCCIYFKLYKK